jgi:hypothetical protein
MLAKQRFYPVFITEQQEMNVRKPFASLSRAVNDDIGGVIAPHCIQ